MFANQKVPSQVTISVNLVTLMCNSGVIIIVRRNQMFVTLRVSRVNDGNEENVSDCK